MNKPITAFTEEYFYLSNYFPRLVFYNDVMYKSSEAAFQAQKDPARAREFAELGAGAAKRLGQQVHLRPDWNAVKDTIMEEVVRCKFAQNQDLKARLLSTKDAELIEGNWWGDTYWGVCNGIGENHLGKILMKIREEFKQTT